MATIVFGAATSHSPMVSSPTSTWESQARKDALRPMLVGPGGLARSFDELAQQPRHQPGDLSPEVWDSKAARVKVAVERLAQMLTDARPDTVVVIGDDQNELWAGPPHPAYAIYTGAQITDLPPTSDEVAHMGEMTQAALWARHAPASETYQVDSALGRHLVARLAGFEVADVSTQDDGRSIGHAYTFVRLRLAGKAYGWKMVPLFVNCLYDPNQPTAAQCVEFGAALKAAIESYPEPIRVAVVASGGLSHFVVDEELDRFVLDLLHRKAFHEASTISQDHLRTGNGEVRNWLVAGAALAGMTMTTIDYIPGYRSAAGTGVGMGFAAWTTT